MRLRFDGECRLCGATLPAGTTAIYERSPKSVRCASHETNGEAAPVEEVPVALGVPGASARREFERRKAGRERQINTKHPRWGRLIHALSEEPQSTTAWDTGAIGEERLGRRLNELDSTRLLVLHDRSVPGSRANIDHLAITPTGVYVIDAKKYKGRPRLKIEGGMFRDRSEKLVVGTRDCTKLVTGVLKQVSVVRDLLDTDLPVHGILCFIDADWPLIGGSFSTQGVEVLRPKKLYPKLQDDGVIRNATIETIHRTLAARLPPA